MRHRRGHSGRVPASVLAVLALLLGAPEANAQDPVPVTVGGIPADTLRVGAPEGFAAVPLQDLEALGWSFESTSQGAVGLAEGLPTLVLYAGNPYVLWGDELIQMAQAPVFSGRALWVPLQLVVDVLPLLAPDRYSWNADSRTLGMPAPEGSTAAEESEPLRTIPATATRVVIIDPGHGGDDPGTVGQAGLREKDVALSLGLKLAEILDRRPDLEVHLTRDEDVLVPIWDRGELATHLKGDRPGVFVSLHLNGWSRDRGVRGFETYFLSEARTEHERRVAALENAALGGGIPEMVPEEDPELGFILNELRNLDHAHWSALLAEMVQGELAGVHPGPNRGVKQAPLAVITNALMPAVLVEVGFVSNRDEERLMSDEDFIFEVAEAVANAVDRFFERYPPGPEQATGGGRP
jgi:N-acetylmuramoyl-L-alanine amidase